MATTNTVSGAEGKVTITAGATGVPIELLVGKWSAEKQPTLGENTNATTGGHKSRKLVVKDTQITMQIFWDSSKVAEDCSLDQGDEITADLRIGSSAKKYGSVPLIIGNSTINGMTTDGLVDMNVTAHVQPPGLGDPVAYP
jgi:hypothetical protein